MPPVTAHSQLSARLQQVLPPARAEPLSLPGVPGIELYLLNDDFPRDRLDPEQMLAVMNYPAYWAFCWASGQVLARLILRHPHWVAGKRVLDFGCGSGVVAIAAARAGAASVIACDLDPDALLATDINARRNRVALTLSADYAAIDRPLDLIIAADVLYDRDNLPWLDRFRQRAPEVLVADSRIRDFRHPGYRLIAREEGTTWPDLDEFDEFRDVRVYRCHG